MDSSANTRRRINADSKNAAQSAQAAATIARLFTTHPNLSKRIESVVPAEEYTPPELGSDIPRPQLVEGETSTQVSQQSYDTFMAKFPTPGEDPQGISLSYAAESTRWRTELLKYAGGTNVIPTMGEARISIHVN
jgi:hypothetical protein